MQKQILKKSQELNDLANELYNIYISTTNKQDFKKILKKISDVFYDSEYVGIETIINSSAGIFTISSKRKKPIYIVLCSSWNCYMLFANDLSSIKKIFNQEKDKLLNKVKLTGALKSINALDASILAYLALAPVPLKNKIILTYLSKASLQLGKCIIGEKGKYNKNIIDTAKLYRDWAFYKKKAHPTRQNLNPNNLYLNI